MVTWGEFPATAFLVVKWLPLLHFPLSDPSRYTWVVCLRSMKGLRWCLAFLCTLDGGFLLCGFCTMDCRLLTGELFQLECTLVFFPVSPANEFAAFHTNWLRVPFPLSWIFQDSFLPELHAEITAFATKSGSSIFSHMIHQTTRAILVCSCMMFFLLKYKLPKSAVKSRIS